MHVKEKWQQSRKNDQQKQLCFIQLESKLTTNDLNEKYGMPSMNKMPLMSELNAKNAVILLMVFVKDLKVLHGSGDEVGKQQLSFLLLSCHCSIDGSHMTMLLMTLY